MIMEKRCWNCANEEDGTGCAECFAGETPSNWKPGQNYAPPTNADHIRAMSDEELAAFLIDVDIDGVTLPFTNNWIDWLRQPWEEDA